MHFGSQSLSGASLILLSFLESGALLRLTVFPVSGDGGASFPLFGWITPFSRRLPWLVGKFNFCD